MTDQKIHYLLIQITSWAHRINHRLENEGKNPLTAIIPEASEMKSILWQIERLAPGAQDIATPIASTFIEYVKTVCMEPECKIREIFSRLSRDILHCQRPTVSIAITSIYFAAILKIIEQQSPVMKLYE